MEKAKWNDAQDPFETGGMLAAEILYDKAEDGRGTREIDPGDFIFEEDDLRLEVGHQNLRPILWESVLYPRGDVQIGGAWKAGAQAYIVTKPERCLAAGLDPCDLAAIRVRLVEEIRMFMAFISPPVIFDISAAAAA